MAVQIQLRRDTAANWTAANPVLAAGEMGVETDTLKLKLGDGSTAWNSLGYGLSAPVVPTGTGFTHITAGTQDGAAKLVEGADVETTAVVQMARLGLGCAADASAALIVQGQYLPKIHTITATTGADPVIAVDWDNSNAQKVTLGHTGTATITLANGIAGAMYRIVLIQPAGGGCAVDYAIPGVKWPAATAPTQNTDANSKDVLTFYYDGTDYLGTGIPNFI